MKSIKKKIITFVLSIATLITALPLGSSVAFAADNYDGGWALVFIKYNWYGIPMDRKYSMNLL